MKKTNFQQVADMNIAFGNPKGDPTEPNLARIRKQCLNIADEFGELMIALGADKKGIISAVETLKWFAARPVGEPDMEGIRDALCDIHVFGYGAHHLLGIDADKDMTAVIEGVLTRFIKDDADKQATIEYHANLGVTKVYFEGEYPRMIMKSAKDQPDAPKGKFLKSASYEGTTFPPVV